MVRACFNNVNCVRTVFHLWLTEFRQEMLGWLDNSLTTEASSGGVEGRGIPFTHVSLSPWAQPLVTATNFFKKTVTAVGRSDGRLAT